MSQHHISGNTDSFYIQDSFNNVWNNCTVANEDSEILAWISPLEPQLRHYDIRTRRVDEVGDWLLKTDEYRDWFGGIHGGGHNGSALFCYGGPGVGKTYIRYIRGRILEARKVLLISCEFSSLVIDTLCKQAVGENECVACFYFDFAVKEELSPDAILASVLKQVLKFRYIS